MEERDAQRRDKRNRDSALNLSESYEGPQPATASGPVQGVVATRERFWILLLFGLSTMVNALGWISLAPVYALVEDVSTLQAHLSYHVLTLASCVTSSTTWAR